MQRELSEVTREMLPSVSRLILIGVRSLGFQADTQRLLTSRSCISSIVLFGLLHHAGLLLVCSRRGSFCFLICWLGNFEKNLV